MHRGRCIPSGRFEEVGDYGELVIFPALADEGDTQRQTGYSAEGQGERRAPAPGPR